MTTLLATVYVTVVTMVRVVILVLSVPLFVMVVLVAGLWRGWGRRDLRRYGAAYESSFVYHHAKKISQTGDLCPLHYLPFLARRGISEPADIVGVPCCWDWRLP